MRLDTVNLWLPEDKIGGGINLDVVSRKLTKVEEKWNRETEQLSIYGSIHNLRVSASKRGVSVQGSLGKYNANDTYGLLSFEDVAVCAESLSDIFNLPMGLAKVMRVDVAVDFIVKNPIMAYISCMQHANRYKRKEQDSGVYYTTAEKVFVLYDKIKELRRSRNKIPDAFKGQHVLRIESRILRNIANRLNTHEVTLCRMTEPLIQKKLIAEWEQAYRSIHKKREFVLGKYAFSTVKEFQKRLMLLGVQAIGGLPIVFSEIENARQMRNIDRGQVKKLKDTMAALANSPSLTYENELVTEIDKLVDQVVAFYK